MKLTSLNSFEKSVKNGSHKIIHVDYAKCDLLTSVSFLSCENFRQILVRVSYFKRHLPVVNQDIIPEMTLLC